MKRIVFKQKFKIALIITLVLVFVFPIVWLGTSYFIRLSKYQLIKNYYYSDTDKFRIISSYFKGLYTDGLVHADLNAVDECVLLLSYKTEDENGESLYSSSQKNISSEKVSLALAELKKKYQKSSLYPIFSGVDAYYDSEGNMLLILKANTTPINKRKDVDYTYDITAYYLIYIDEYYHGNGSFLDIDKFGVTREPFSDNWCVWSRGEALN